jgi:lipid II:glycine glycyltransferase (peptidoglycan interpeptide bridge formation enzyme)
VRIYVEEKGSAITASALVVIDRTVRDLSTWDLPRGPLWTEDADINALMRRIVDDAVADHGLAVYTSPSLPLKTEIRTVPSPRHEQPEASIVLDLRVSEEQLLAQMLPKGRYNIGVAKRHGVNVRETRDVDAFTALAKETALRDGFRAPSAAHYQAFLDHLPGSFLLLAFESESATQPIGGLLGAIWGACGIYYYGASSYAHRALMAPFLLQWEAMAHCRTAGAMTYDLLGIAPPDAGSGHPWAGITGFKRKFGGTIVTYPPEHQCVLRPLSLRAIRLKRKILG